MTYLIRSVIMRPDREYNRIRIAAREMIVSDAVYMPLHDMSAKAPSGLHRSLQIDPFARTNIFKVGMPVRLRHHINRKG